MEYVGRVKIFHGTEQIVDDQLDVLELQMNCRLDNLLEIALSQLQHHVNGFE